MPATAKGYPWPAGTEALSTGDDAIHALADFLEANAPLARSGNVVVTTNASGAFNIPLSPALPGVPRAVFYTAGDPAGNAAAAIRTVVANLASTWTAALITGNCYRGDNAIAVSVSARLNYLAVY